MFKRLVTKNFQAHKKLELDFSTVTTIVGPSDVGKSAIIRAITWLATNRPAGTEFIREGAKRTTVQLEVDGHTIIRERGKSVNRYVLDGQEYKAFGTEPPDDVTDVLNLSGINFQQQHDAPFWFRETPGEISRQLNQIVNLEIIDSTLANLDRAKRDASTRVKVLEEEVAGAAELRSSLAWVKRADSSLRIAEELHSEYTETSGNRASLENLMGEVSRYTATLNNQRETARMAENTVRKGEAWKEVVVEEAELDRLITFIHDQQDIVSRPIPDPSPLLQLDQAWSQAVEEVQQLTNRINAVRSSDREAKRAHAQLAEAESEFKERMGDVCPLCGNKL